MKNTLTNVVEKFDLLKIFSLFVAIILFLSVNPTFANPIWNTFFQTTQKIPEVPLNVVYDSKKYVIQGVPPTIDVNVSGNESSVTDIANKSDSLVATLDLSTQPVGEHSISASEISFNVSNSSNVTITPAIDNFNVIIEEKISKEIKISTTYINGDKLTNGVILDVPKLPQNSVNVTGGNVAVDSVVSVLGLIDLQQLEVSSDNGVAKLQMKLNAYDESGSIVSNVELSTDSLIVEQPYQLKTIKLPVSYSYTNNETGMYVSSICPIENVNCDQNSVEYVSVYGDSQKISQLNTITYEVDLTGVSENGGQVVAEPILDSNVFIVEEQEKTYNVELEKGTKKTIENVSIQTVNLSPELSAISETTEDARVSVIVDGPESLVNQLEAEDIFVFIDLKAYTQPGKYEVPVSVKYVNNVTVTLDKDKVSVIIKEKESE